MSKGESVSHDPIKSVKQYMTFFDYVHDEKCLFFVTENLQTLSSKQLI